MRGAGGQARWTLCIHPSAIIVSDTRPKGGGKDGEGREGIVHGIESLRFCSGTDPSDERRSRFISSFSILPIVEKQTASRDAMKLSRLASGEWRGGKKKKKR